MIITLGDTEIPAELPIWPHRFRLHNAVREVVTFEPVDLQAFGALAHAAIGLCWRGDPLDHGTLRSYGHDLVAYGDAVFDSLYRAGHTDIVAIGAEGARLQAAIVDSLITGEEIEAAADPTEAPAGACTGSM